MQVRFWGTRGSLAKPGPSTIRYGGNTSCVEIRAADGTLIILDCGTGAHDLGQTLLRNASGPINGSLLISHTHWDHIQGIPFFAPFFVPGNEWDIYAPQGFGETLRTTLAGQMEYTYFPITAETFGASLRYHNLSEGEFRIGNVRVVTRYLNHPALTIGYRIEADGAAVVYACDHEPHSSCAATSSGELEGQDLLHSEFLRDADLVIHDAQYTADEYSTKTGWGHSTVHYAVNVCARAGVRTLALTHHDPMRSDDQVDRLLIEAKSLVGDADLDIIAASEGLVLELIGTSKAAMAETKGEEKRLIATSDCLLMITSDAKLSNRVKEIAKDEQLTVMHASSVSAALSMIEAKPPSLIIVDGNLPLGMIDQITNRTLPTIILGGGALNSAPDTFEQIDAVWTSEYLRSRIRTWMMREKFAHMPAAMPEGEAERLAAVRALQLLDTPREERFDRLTRIAARMFDVPTSLVTLVDANRQWFKAKEGLAADETPRHMSFCAHAILERRPMVIPDALADKRFAQNPLVVGDPRIRFYAGIPLLAGNQPVGTLCLIDSKPRTLSDKDLQALSDLAAIVEVELAAVATPDMGILPETIAMAV